MEEIKKRVYQYRTFTIKYTVKTGEWTITKSNGQPFGTSYSNPQLARDYINDVLLEMTKPVKSKTKIAPQIMNVELDGEQDRSNLGLND